MQLSGCLTFPHSGRRSRKKPSEGNRLAEPTREVHVDGLGVDIMSITLENVVIKYLSAKKLSSGTCKEYRSTATKWITWGKGVEVDQIERTHIRDFLDWVHEKATVGRWLQCRQDCQQGPRKPACHLWHGHGSRTICRSSRDYPSPNHSAMWLDDIT